MEIKMGRDTYTVSNRDVIMDNGAVILVKTKGAYMSRKLFNELLKKGVIVPYEAFDVIFSKYKDIKHYRFNNVDNTRPSVVHRLKIKAEYAKAKIGLNKLFEIRFNDRDYHVGDVIKYTVIDDEIVNAQIADNVYTISYITSYEQKEGYVVFGEKVVYANRI